MGWTGTPRTWVVGEFVVPAQLNTELRDALTGIGSAWTAYTPVITGYTTATFTGSGAYQQIGKSVWFRAQFALATVTTLGTATINVSLPVAASAALPYANQSGTALYRTNAGVYVAGVLAIAASATTASLLIPTPGGATPNMLRLTGAAPAGQVVGDTFMITGCYEPA